MNNGKAIETAVQSCKQVLRRLRQILYRPQIQIRKVSGLVRMGSVYGGWTFLHRPALQGVPIISAGLGEDASFDIEFAARYQGRVILVDPTPRAITHFKNICQGFGRAAQESYASNGCQPVAAYDLSSLGESNFSLVSKALWTGEDQVKFFAPPETSHVSHSISNYQNSYARGTPFIEVASTTVRAIMDEYGLTDLELIKLDIEGAETAVISNMLESGIFPNQILVEFDELWLASASSKKKAEACDRALRSHGYECFHWDGKQNFSYARKPLLEQAVPS